MQPTQVDATIDLDIAGEFKIYPTKAKAIHAMRGARPVSAFYLTKDDQTETGETIYYVCYRERSVLWAIQFTLFEESTITYNNIKYYALCYPEKTTTNLKYLIGQSKQYCGVLLLPLLCESGYPIREVGKIYHYCMVDSKWDLVGSNKQHKIVIFIQILSSFLPD